MDHGEDVCTHPWDSLDALVDRGQNPDRDNVHQGTVASPCRMDEVAYQDLGRNKGRLLVHNPYGPYLTGASRDPVHMAGEALVP